MWWVEEPDGYISWIAVDQEYRRRGIGSAMYDHLMERARDAGARRLKVWIREGDEGTSRFALSRGYSYTPRTQRLSRLDVRTANLDGFEGVEERLRDGGVRIATLAEIGMEEDFLRKLHAMSDATIRDVPSSDPFGSTPFEIFLRDLTEGPGMSPEWCWVAVDGDRPIGLAFLKIQGDAAFNEYTATDREYRGRGIARALKLRTILWCREHGINYIYTGNDIDNKRMLDINIRLGYEMLPPFREIVKELK
jgi:GNAT superfamily N-acetyltransferase